MIIRIVGSVAAVVILYAGTLQLVYTSKREDSEPAATAWTHFWTGWMPDSWTEALAVKMDQNFLNDRRAKRRLEELKANR